MNNWISQTFLFKTTRLHFKAEPDAEPSFLHRTRNFMARNRVKQVQYPVSALSSTSHVIARDELIEKWLHRPRPHLLSPHLRLSLSSRILIVRKIKSMESKSALDVWVSWFKTREVRCCSSLKTRDSLDQHSTSTRSCVGSENTNSCRLRVDSTLNIEQQQLERWWIQVQQTRCSYWLERHLV